MASRKNQNGTVVTQLAGTADDVLTLTTDAFVAVDESCRVTCFNAVSGQTSKTNLKNALRKTLWTVCPQLEGTALQRSIVDALKSRTSAEVEHFHKPTGRWFLVRLHPARKGLLLFFHEITDRKQAGSQRRTPYERAFEVLESISDAFLALDENWCVTYVNGRAEEVLQRQHEDLIGKVLWEEFPPLVGTELFCNLRMSMGEQRRIQFVTDIPNLGCAEIDAHPCASGLCVYFCPTACPGECNRLAVPAEEQIVWAEERERRRIGRELHDGTSQLLIALTIGLSNMADVTTITEARCRARRLRALASRVSKEVGLLSRGLHGLGLWEGGLIAALDDLVVEWKQTYGITIELAGDDVGQIILPMTTQMSLYRIVQEALSNVARHSGAARAWVQFRARDSILELVVRDDGRGFSRAPQGRKHVGLRSMRDRAKLLGGKLTILSTPDKGTCVRVSIPVWGEARQAS